MNSEAEKNAVFAEEEFNGKDNKENTYRKNKRILAIILAVAALILCFFGGFFTHYLSQGKTLRTLTEVLKIIDDAAVNYVGEGDDKSGDDAVRAVVKELLYYDKYAAYYSAEEYKALLAESSGNYSGFGLTFVEDNKVYAVTGNSPADRAGIKAGDVILAGKKEGETDFTVFSGKETVADFLLSLDTGDSITLKVRNDAGIITECTLKKENYQVSYVKYYDSGTYMFFRSDDGGKPKSGTDDSQAMTVLGEDTAYISLSLFEGDAAEQFLSAMKFMESRGRTKLILDLRGNGGGYMDILTDIASCLIQHDGKYVLAYVKEKGKTEVFKADSDDYYDGLKGVTVLADYGTASASECLIGAMLCHGGAEGGNGFSMSDLVISYNPSRGNYSTYGKGIMQTTYRLSTGGALKLTTAKIVWPDDETCIQGVGIEQTDPANCVAADGAILRAVEILAAKG